MVKTRPFVHQAIVIVNDIRYPSLLHHNFRNPNNISSSIIIFIDGGGFVLYGRCIRLLQYDTSSHSTISMAFSLQKSSISPLHLPCLFARLFYSHSGDWILCYLVSSSSSAFPLSYIKTLEYNLEVGDENCQPNPNRIRNFKINSFRVLKSIPIRLFRKRFGLV